MAIIYLECRDYQVLSFYKIYSSAGLQIRQDLSSIAEKDEDVWYIL